MKIAFKRHFWIISLILLSLFGIISYGFVKNLFFWREDYQVVYSYFARIPYYFWPYQGLSIIYYPFVKLFGNNPQGYFLTAWILLVIAAFTLEVFTLKLSKNRATALMAGIIFMSGYVGSEAMMLVSVNIISNLYLILLLVFLINYENLFKPHNHKSFWFLYLISLILFSIFSHRAQILPILIVISEWYYFRKNKTEPLWPLIKQSLRRVAPFIATAILVYSIFPLFLATKEKHLGQISWDMILNVANPNFWLDMWNLIFPSELLKISVQAGAVLGLTSFAILAFFSYKKRLAIYLGLSTIFSYVIFHMFSYDLIHSSWDRYFFYSYAFLSSFLAVIFSDLLKSKKWLFVPAIILIISHLYVIKKSEFINRGLERGQEARHFFSQLKGVVTEISSPTLFYFDSIMDPSIEFKLNSILSGGVFPAETAIAAIYKADIQNIKVANDYEEFDTLRKSKKYSHQYFLFYDKTTNLINLSDKPDSTTRASLGRASLNITPGGQETTEIEVNNFPAFKPISVKIEMSAALTSNLGTNTKSGVSNSSSLVAYIEERDNFRKNVRVNSSGSEFPGRDQFLVDGDLESSWLANKILWRDGNKPWIEFNFPRETAISEIRWISSYQSRLPVSYEYQIQDSLDGSWKSIFSVNKSSPEANKYQVDKVNKVLSKNFRMVINETSGEDFPAISEFEILESNWNVDSAQANFAMLNPSILQSELRRLVDNFNFYLYPITDKYWAKPRSIKISKNLFLDGKFHFYQIDIPPGGTSLNKIILEFPKLPLKIRINSISLEN